VERASGDPRLDRGSGGVLALGFWQARGVAPRATRYNLGMPGAPDDVSLQGLVEFLPPRIWYLTSNGQDMWCRRPYGFLFSTGQGAETFARAMGTDEQLFAIGIEAGALISDEVLGGLRASAVTRIFIDPTFDAASGDVHGKILRLAPLT
jgi:hypothetical protein